MSETFEEPGVAVEANPEGAQHAEPDTLAVSMHDFAALEDRVLRAVDLVKHARQERTAAEARAAQAEERAAQNEERAAQAEALAAQAGERAAQAEAKVREQAPVVDGMQSELRALKAERDHVRQRVERLLEQLDGLEL
jgi:flagellar biosynthesis/type III secretory pathway protein FliH